MPTRAPGGGRKRKPTALKLLEGNLGRRELPQNEPFPTTVAPSYPAPDWLGEAAKKVWELLVPEMSAIGLLTVVDIPKFARYCDAWERWKEARDWIAKNGPLIEAYEVAADTDPKDTIIRKRLIKKGYKAHPWVRVYNQMNALLTQLESEFGMSPVARTRIHIVLNNPNGAPPPQEPFEYDD